MQSCFYIYMQAYTQIRTFFFWFWPVYTHWKVLAPIYIHLYGILYNFSPHHNTYKRQSQFVTAYLDPSPPKSNKSNKANRDQGKPPDISKGQWKSHFSWTIKRRSGESRFKAFRLIQELISLIDINWQYCSVDSNVSFKQHSIACISNILL